MTVDRSLIWCGPINNSYAIGGTVGLYDTTLRDGDQTAGVVLDPGQKLMLARAIDRLGVGRIEAGFPRVASDDGEAIRLILDADLRAEVWGFGRAFPADVETLLELGLKASIIETPISDTKLNALGVTRDEMLDRIQSAIAVATSGGMRVAFFGVDGSRTDPSYLRLAYDTAIGAGATEVVVVDTLGIASPEAVAQLVTTVRGWISDDVAIHFHGHNDFGVATAAAIAAVRAGAAWVHGTINGMGERAGNANLLEVALALEALYGVDTGLRLREAQRVSRLVRETCGYTLDPWKPATGETLFRRESDAIVSQFHQPEAIEPYSSTVVGLERGVLLGKKSGLASIRIVCAELGLMMSAGNENTLLERVKQLGVEKRGLVSTQEFLDLAATLARKPQVNDASTAD